MRFSPWLVEQLAEQGYRDAAVMNSTVESCVQPRSSFLYQRMTIPVFLSSGESWT